MDDASIADPDDSDTSGTNEETVDAAADAANLHGFGYCIRHQWDHIATTESVRSDWNYVTNDGTRTVNGRREGQAGKRLHLTAERAGEFTNTSAPRAV